MWRRILIAITVLAMLGAVIVGYRVEHRREAAFCGFCHRALHANIQVVAEIDGERRVVCCARCAITEANQEKKPLHLLTVTDYTSGGKLNPKQAFYVDGSQKVLCLDGATMFDETKHAYEKTYDRCFPGTYAFAHREEAEKFARENGGVVVQLDKLMQEVGSQP
jgi:hypothetical protein